jgi:hypothetical protein
MMPRSLIVLLAVVGCSGVKAAFEVETAGAAITSPASARRRWVTCTSGNRARGLKMAVVM